MHPPGLNQIDPTDTAEVALFADALSITAERLLEIVAMVGPMRPAIRFYAMRDATEPKRGASKAAPRATTPTEASTRAVQPHTLFRSPSTRA